MVVRIAAMKVPLLVAHRGHASRYPENTLESVEAALAAGACFVEVDVQMTADSVPVLLHDPDLRRVAGRSAKVRELSWSELSEVEVGDGARVPTLAAAIELLGRWPLAQAFIEVKPDAIRAHGVERVFERVRADFGADRSRCILISSVDGLLVHARQQDQIRIGLVLREWSDRARDRVAGLAPEFVFCNLSRIPADAELWKGSWKWVVYEVASPRLALDLARRGVELIETMAIGEMLEDPVLGERGCLE